MSEFRGLEFKFYLNNNVRNIELVITDSNFHRFIKFLAAAKYRNKISELNISIGNSEYLKPLLYLLMGKNEEGEEITPSNLTESSSDISTLLQQFTIISDDEVGSDRYLSRRTEPLSKTPYPYLTKVFLHHIHDAKNQKELILEFIKKMDRLDEFRTGDFKWKREYVYEFNFTL
mmetsp:Transcript_4656/g.5349  ORF Transcript_4656/g.5349 Transcript_4656/m.5349 type:complete len:174 (-) Transcript_4656:23-544(-)